MRADEATGRLVVDIQTALGDELLEVTVGFERGLPNGIGPVLADRASSSAGIFSPPLIMPWLRVLAPKPGSPASSTATMSPASRSVRAAFRPQ